MTRFNIFTPCRNAESRIAETVESVLGQTAVATGRAELSYVILDGASTDGTVEVARRYAHPSLRIISEPDDGMYDALAKGLRGARDGICAYLNAGDLYARQAFDVVLDVVESKRVRWVTGMEVACNDRSQVIHVRLPFRYRARFFRCGAYGTLLPFVQQESTFWDASLNAAIDFERLRRFRLAGDYYLWHSFARVEPLSIVEAHLGTFRIHSGQMSEGRLDEYRREMREVCGPLGLGDRLVALADAVVWRAPASVKKKLNPRGLFRYDARLETWV